MEPGTRKKFAIIFFILIILIGVRVGLIWRERHQADQAKPVENKVEIPSDAYVVPPKLHAYDLASAKSGLEGKTIWVESGGVMQYYPVHGTAVDAAHPAGTLEPLDALHVVSVIETRGPSKLIQQGKVTIHTNGDKQVMAIFTHPGSAAKYAVPIAAVEDGNYNFNVDDAFFLEDPHTLYKQWPAETWSAIDQHRAIAGMNELQTALALGPGKVVDGSPTDYGNRTMQYGSGNKTETVTFQSDKATNIQTQ
jgi:hypothetical protein